ncbi:LPS translocon maturation chaperone LptM [Vreelandella titanicae]|nr:lipoprotein [Halomonas titanicae]MCE7517754.1 lipoprotein [Halomonas titanicae]NVE89100.1 lipoprotein [Halomonas titanicae]|tara:strand:- start:856 stop:999 length:144 start_codon:yes stop_codon:yes gene_type:complete
MKTLAIIALTALLLTAVTACGQKGPLYLPDNAPADEQSTQSSDQPSE